MASAYPSGLDNQSTAHQDNVGEFIHASTVNDLADAVNKIEAELGTLPKGQFSSVSAKLKALFYGQVTTTQRDAITAGNRPPGLIVFNTTTNRYEYNSGSDVTPTWVPVGPAGPWATSDIQDSAITSIKIANGTIVDADISSSAAITLSKLNTSGTPSSSTYLRGDAAWTALTLSQASSFLGADVPLTSANTTYDGPSIVLAAGTWFVVAQTAIQRGGQAANNTIRLFDSTNSAVISSNSCNTRGANNGDTTGGAVHGFVSPGGTITVKLQAIPDSTTQIMKAATSANPQGNTATGVFAIRVG